MTDPAWISRVTRVSVIDPSLTLRVARVVVLDPGPVHNVARVIVTEPSPTHRDARVVVTDPARLSHFTAQQSLWEHFAANGGSNPGSQDSFYNKSRLSLRNRRTGGAYEYYGRRQSEEQPEEKGSTEREES